MKYAFGLVALSIGLVVSGCASRMVPLPAVALKTDSGSLSLKELSEKRQQLSGQVVRVYGFYYQHADACVLYPDRESAERQDNTLALSVGPVKPKSMAARESRRDGEWVLIEGTFVNASTGIFDSYFAQINELTDFQKLTGNPDQVTPQT